MKAHRCFNWKIKGQCAPTEQHLHQHLSFVSNLTNYVFVNHCFVTWRNMNGWRKSLIFLQMSKHLFGIVTKAFSIAYYKVIILLYLKHKNHQIKLCTKEQQINKYYVKNNLYLLGVKTYCKNKNKPILCHLLS